MQLIYSNINVCLLLMRGGAKQSQISVTLLSHLLLSKRHRTLFTRSFSLIILIKLK